MTDQDIVNLAVSDPEAIRRHTTYDPAGGAHPPALSFLQGLAEGELQAEIASLMAWPPIRRRQLEKYTTMSLSGGTDMGRGLVFELASDVATVLSVTTDARNDPLQKKDNREDFDHWYAEMYGSSVVGSDPSVWVPWQKSATGNEQVLISPAIGSATTARIHYIQRMSPPFSVSILPEDTHFLVLFGVKNRLTGGVYQQNYLSERENVASRLESVLGGVTPARHSDQVRAMNCRRSSIISGQSSSLSRYPRWQSVT